MRIVHTAAPSPQPGSPPTDSLVEGITVYAVCPAIQPSETGPEHLETIRTTAAWTEDAGLDGLLIVVFNQTLAPWAAAHAIIESSERLAPLVALQPLYTHPFELAREIASLSHLYGRRIDLNLVAGGSSRDLLALGDDDLSREGRYRRLADYTRIVMRLLADEDPLTFESPFYSLDGLALRFRPAPEDLPRLLLSGSSEAAESCAHDVGALRVQNAEPLPDEIDEGFAADLAFKVGIISRPSRTEAWGAAEARFPRDANRERKPYEPESEWQRRLEKLDADYGAEASGSVYWLRAFQRREKQFAYLVGSYEEVASYLAGYLRMGARNFIFDVPYDADEVAHSSRVMQLAVASLGESSSIE